MFCAMGEDAALHSGAAEVTKGDLWLLAIVTLVVPAALLFPWAVWHLRGWRIRKARAAGKHDIADVLALDHDEDDPPKSPATLIPRAALMMIGAPLLIVFQENLMDELEHMMGPGWGFAAMALTLGFIFACGWMWDKVKRNAMSPEELAALEEEEEHQRWLRSIGDGDSLPAPVVAIAIGLVFLGAVYFLFSAITPG